MNLREVVNEGAVVEVGTPTEKSKGELSELSLLKAKVHQLTMINQMLQDDNYKLKRAAQGAQLREQQSALEKELQAEGGTDKKFDWNTLSFPKDK